MKNKEDNIHKNRLSIIICILLSVILEYINIDNDDIITVYDKIKFVININNDFNKGY